MGLGPTQAFLICSLHLLQAYRLEFSNISHKRGDVNPLLVSDFDAETPSHFQQHKRPLSRMQLYYSPISMGLPRLGSPRPSPFFNKENLDPLQDTEDLMMHDENKDNGRFTRNVIDNENKDNGRFTRNVI